LSGPKARPLDIIYGADTLPQSVKLDLMARGLATPEGNKAEPRRPALKNLNVSIGHYDAFPAFGQMVKVNDLDPSFVDRFMIPPTADGAPSQAPAAGEISPTGDHERSRGVSLPEGYSLHDRTGRFFGSVEKILMYGE
jgi:hypothetical protein